MIKADTFLSKLMLLLIVTGISVIMVSCGAKNGTNTPGTVSNPSPSGGSLTPAPTVSAAPSDKPGQSPIPAATAAADSLKQRIDKMTVDEKIGQLVLIGLDGTVMQAQAKEMIEKHRVTGFILYKNNITSAAQTLNMLNQLKETNRKNAFPLWLSVDQEGGKVDRMPEPLIKLPAAQDVGRTNKTSYSFAIGQALGEEVRALGFNMDYAPVLDVNSNPNNPVIGNRSFGSEPKTVIQHGIQVMKGLQSTKVVPVVKHFPGHGDTSVDSHLALPVVPKSLEELRAFELLPFAEAIKQQAEVVMVGHLLLPQIDDQNPASLSDKVINGLLRQDMKFGGVVITDDMTMGGITEHNDVGEAAVRAILAGTDIVLVGHEYAKQISVIQALKKAVTDGVLTVKRLDESVTRIAGLKLKYDLQDSTLKSVDPQEVNRKVQALLEAGQK
jgi:beta-N-acetylhexosaminidase